MINRHQYKLYMISLQELSVMDIYLAWPFSMHHRDACRGRTIYRYMGAREQIVLDFDNSSYDRCTATPYHIYGKSNVIKRQPFTRREHRD